MSQPAVGQELRCPRCQRLISSASLIAALSVRYFGNAHGTIDEMLGLRKTQLFFEGGGRYLYAPVQHLGCGCNRVELYRDGHIELHFAGYSTRRLKIIR